MTVSHKPMLATVCTADLLILTTDSAAPENPKRSDLFKRHKLAALIAGTILLHACSSLPDKTAEEQPQIKQPELSSVQPRNNPIRQSRSIASPVWQLDNTNDGIATPAHEQTVWFQVGQGIQFALKHHNDDIQEQIDWFSNNPDYLLQVTDRSAPFIYEIVAEIKRRNLPLELALLPVIESAYDPAAQSSADAAGLWQFMAATATTFGLKRDWWYDGRNDPIASTSAALDYLERLNAQFDGDWLLVLAAYNAGEGTVMRAIERNQQRDRPTDFWSLPLPKETQRHIPRLLGLAHVMANPERYGVSLSHIPDQPYLASVDVGSQIDLTLVANLANLEPDMVSRLNPGYLQWATHPDGPHTVWLPVDTVEIFETNFSNMEFSPITWDRYVIKSGDTLGAIARGHSTQVSVLQQVNNLSDSRIATGQTLLIPRAYRDGDPLSSPSNLLAAANTQPVPTTAYSVRSGDTLWAIANRYKLSINELAALNGIEPNGVLRPGQSLRMQPQITLASNDTPSAINDSELPTITEYQVRRGDTLLKIAREHNVSVQKLTEWNRINTRSIIRPGQALIIHQTP